MPKGRTTRVTVSLTPQDRTTIEAWQLATSMPVGRVRRGRMLLLLVDGLSITQVAAAVGISRRHVYKWVARFQAQGLAGLVDRPHPRPLAHPAGHAGGVVTDSMRVAWRRPGGYSNWTQSSTVWCAPAAWCVTTRRTRRE